MINSKSNQEMNHPPKQAIGLPRKDAPYEVKRDCTTCLLELGYSHEDIVSITGLSLEDVREIDEAGYSPYLCDDMVDFEWNQERALEIAREDSFARGMVIGMKKVIARKKAEGDLDIALEVRHDLILYMMRKEFAIRDITKATGASDEEIYKIAQENYISGYWKVLSESYIFLFTPLAPYETPEALDRLCAEYNRVIGNGEVEPLITIAIFKALHLIPQYDMLKLIKKASMEVDGGPRVVQP